MSDAVDRRRRAAQAGHQGDAAGARQLLADSDASVRAAAVGALSRLGALTDTEARAALGDPDAQVRATALAALTRMGAATPADFTAALADPEAIVRRRACELAAASEVDLGPSLADETRIPVHLVDAPLECVVLGAGKCLESFESVKVMFMGADGR